MTITNNAAEERMFRHIDLQNQITDVLAMGVVESADRPILTAAIERLEQGEDMTQVQAGKWSKYCVRLKAMRVGSFSSKFSTPDCKWLICVDGIATSGDKVVVTKKDGSRQIVTVGKTIQYDSGFDQSHCLFRNY